MIAPGPIWGFRVVKMLYSLSEMGDGSRRGRDVMSMARTIRKYLSPRSLRTYGKTGRANVVMEAGAQQGGIGGFGFGYCAAVPRVL